MRRRKRQPRKKRVLPKRTQIVSRDTKVHGPSLFRALRTRIEARLERLQPPPAFIVAGAATLATVLFSGVVDAAPVKKVPSMAPPAAVATAVATPKPPPVKFHFVPAKDRPAWGAALPTVSVTNNNTGAKGSFRIYTDHGSLDLESMKEFMTVVNGPAPGEASPLSEKETKLDTRLVQLAFRAAYHFQGAPITIVSGTRKGTHGKHATGEALDFKLEGVKASDLAKYVRSFPRAGIGIYTNPKTQYVHVDVRERSYQWIDASPPGVTWREQLLADPKQQERDDGYTAAADLPETAR